MISALKVRTYESLEDLENLRPAWEQLLPQASTATIFSTWEWLAPWWRAFGGGQKLIVLAFWDSACRLVGVAPMALSRYAVSRGWEINLLRLMGDGSGDSDYLDLLVRPGYEEEVARALLDYLQNQRSQWDLCSFNTLPANSAAGNVLLRRLEKLGWTFAVYQQPGSVLVLPNSWKAYLNQVSRKERDNIRYYLRRLERRHRIRFYKCTQESELPARLESLLKLHQKRWQLRGQAGTFASAARRQFYQEMAHLFLARGWLEFWLLEVDGRAAAAQFSFRYRDTVYALQQGFDPTYATLCVQDVLRSHVLRQLIAEGVRRYDFLAGQDVRKTRWGTKPNTYLGIYFARPFTRGSAYLRLADNAGKSKEWLRAHLPKRAWAVLRSFYRKLHPMRSQPQEMVLDLPGQSGSATFTLPRLGESSGPVEPVGVGSGTFGLPRLKAPEADP